MTNNALTLYMIGNAHLDPAWMWTWGEGAEAFIATCRSALDRMNETPELVFTCSSAAHYRWVEELEPELFEKIRQRVAEGRWEIVGGWWVQADCNLPSGEGFVRQALLGQRYFAEKFGHRARTGYSPDAFGHNIGLPQLLSRSGMSNYIFCRPDPTELTLPSPLFIWRSPDGSEVHAYRVPFHYNMYESSIRKKVSGLMDAWSNPSPLTYGEPLSTYGDEWAIFYGVGNHGGGPTKEHIRDILALDADPEEPRLVFSRLTEFFESGPHPTSPAARSPSPKRGGAEERQGGSDSAPSPVFGGGQEVQQGGSDSAPSPVFGGGLGRGCDLQLDAPGCYSAHSQIKLLNRRSEHLLMAGERLSSLASLLVGADYPAENIRRAWRNVCFNHFHDLLCGVAIREALDEAIETYGEALTIAKRSMRYAVQRIARSIDTTGSGQTLIVFNPHAWDVVRHVTFELWHDIDKSLWTQPVHLRVADDDGNELPHQMEFPSGKIGRDRIAATFNVNVPALGWRCYRVHYGEQPSVSAAPTNVIANETTLENALVRVEFSRSSGAITSMYHKTLGCELLNGEAALPIAINDRTDTWGHGVESFNDVIGTFGHADVRLVEHGPTHSTVRSISRWRNSWVQQDFRLYHDSDRVHVSVKLFWAEQYVMLKLAFATAFTDPIASYEAAYSSIDKPCNGIERPGGTWAAIRGAIDGRAVGIGIPNDAKHGYSADSSTLAMTVLRSPSYATHDPHPRYRYEDLDFLDQGVQRFIYVIAPVVGDGFRAELHREAALLNAPLMPHFESVHEPTAHALLRTHQSIAITPDNVVASVLKKGEDRGWVVRLYETAGIECEARISMPLLNVEWSAVFAPHQLRTFVIEGQSIEEVDLVEFDFLHALP